MTIAEEMRKHNYAAWRNYMMEGNTTRPTFRQSYLSDPIGTTTRQPRPDLMTPDNMSSMNDHKLPSVLISPEEDWHRRAIFSELQGIPQIFYYFPETDQPSKEEELDTPIPV